MELILRTAEAYEFYSCPNKDAVYGNDENNYTSIKDYCSILCLRTRFHSYNKGAYITVPYDHIESMGISFFVVDHCTNEIYYYYDLDYNYHDKTEPSDIIYINKTGTPRLYAKVDNFEKIFGNTLSKEHLLGEYISDFEVSPVKFREFSSEKLDYIMTSDDTAIIDYKIQFSIDDITETVNRRIKFRVNYDK